jgi:hypothetical protein
LREPGGAGAIVNPNTLEGVAPLTQDSQPMDYGAVDEAQRLARRRRRWSPATGLP